MSDSYQTKIEDLEKWFKFSINYWLEPSKGTTGRTSGQPRGLGDVMDSFSMKILEDGVARILENRFSNNKKFITDDIIKPDNDIKEDPDIMWIEDNNSKKRDPKAFIEVKYHSLKSDWIGPRIKQKESFEKGATKRKIKEENIYIIGADFNNDSSIKDNDKKESLLGIFLKKHTKSDLFKDFYDTMPKIIIKYAIRLKDLEKYGTFFSKGENFFNSSVFEIKKIHNKDGNLSRGHKIIEYPHLDKSKNVVVLCYQKEGNLNSKGIRKKINLFDSPEKKFGEFNILNKGSFDIIKKENEKTDRCFIYCYDDITLENKVFGKHILSKEKAYSFQLITKGRDPILKSDNIFISENYLKVLQNNKIIDSNETILREIANLA